MHDYQTAFLKLALEHEVLRFGEFTLKSGRHSPYFFNLGNISSGAAMRELGRAYAQALMASNLKYDMLFGPAYKGIPLVTATSIALAEAGQDTPYAYNRKEAKTHGEGGVVVGAAPAGRVVIVDDVLTAGTALREAVALLRSVGAQPVAAVIALDRQERGASGRSAVQEMEQDCGIRVIALVNVMQMLQYLEQDKARAQTVSEMVRYQALYGVT